MSPNQKDNGSFGFPLLWGLHLETLPGTAFHLAGCGDQGKALAEVLETQRLDRRRDSSRSRSAVREWNPPRTPPRVCRLKGNHKKGFFRLEQVGATRYPKWSLGVLGCFLSTCLVITSVVQSRPFDLLVFQFWSICSHGPKRITFWFQALWATE